MYDHSKSSEVPSTPPLAWCLVNGIWPSQVIAVGCPAFLLVGRGQRHRPVNVKPSCKLNWSRTDLWDLGLGRASCLPWSLVCVVGKACANAFWVFRKLRRRTKHCLSSKHFHAYTKKFHTSWFSGLKYAQKKHQKHILCDRQRCSTAWWTWQPIVVGFLSSWCLGLKLGWEWGNVHRENGLNRADCIWLHESRIFFARHEAYCKLQDRSKLVKVYAFAQVLRPADSFRAFQVSGRHKWCEVQLLEEVQAFLGRKELATALRRHISSFFHLCLGSIL